MELFQLIRKSFKIIGIYPSESDGKFSSLNLRNVTLMFCLFMATGSSIMSLLYECETMLDYSMSIFAISTNVIISIIVPVLVSNSSKIFEYIDDLEIFIQQREFYQLFN